MAAESKDLARPYFEKGKGDALVHYVVFGAFNLDAPLSASKHRTSGLPDGVETRKVVAADSRDRIDGLFADFGKYADDAGMLKRAKAAPECVYVDGTVKDPEDLAYLRNTVGVVQWLLENGGVGVLEMQTLSWFSPAQWKADFFDVAPEDMVSRHIVILQSEESKPGTSWFHTRGLRKFGRPDLSFHGVTKAMADDVDELFHRFIGMEARGGWIPEGKEIKLGDLPKGLAAHHGGSLEDPEFNNVHVEFRVPAGK